MGSERRLNMQGGACCLSGSVVKIVHISNMETGAIRGKMRGTIETKSGERYECIISRGVTRDPQKIQEGDIYLLINARWDSTPKNTRVIRLSPDDLIHEH
jgi:hypothetical protein